MYIDFRFVYILMEKNLFLRSRACGLVLCILIALRQSKLVWVSWVQRGYCQLSDIARWLFDGHLALEFPHRILYIQFLLVVVGN